MNALGRAKLVFGVVVSVLLAGCPLHQDEDAELRQMLADNGVTPLDRPALNPAMVRLGQALFFDKELSGNRNISCATCHHPTLATSDGSSLGAGQGGDGLGPERSVPLDELGNPIFIPRNAPDVFSRADFATMFWDGRVEELADGTLATPAGMDLLPGLDSALAAQSMFPVTSQDEMRGLPGDNELANLASADFQGVWTALMDRLMAIEGYRQLFADAYPGVALDDLTFAHAGNAMAAFEAQHWTLLDSPFDRFLAGDDSAMTDQQKAGMRLFYSEAGCARCHSGPLLTDQDYHNVGVPQLGPGKGDGADGRADYGRERVTQDPADRYKFRTPPLRNVAATGPWTHDGAFTSLAGFVRHYVNVPQSAQNYDPTQLEPLLQDQVLASETPEILARLDENLHDIVLDQRGVEEIVAFLRALTSPSLPDLPARDIPVSVPSGLPMANR